MNTVVQGDCVSGMKSLQAGTVNLVFADPPFNIGYEYDQYQDNLGKDAYLRWSLHWIAEAQRVLSATGTLWIAIGDDYAAELVVIAKSLGMTMRNWVIWHYTFGVNCQRKFTRSHTHLLYFVKSPSGFIFNSPDIKIPSARQTKYNDKRAVAGGRIPDDVWTFPRVCGTFKERQGWHPCQMPEAVLERIIRACSAPGDLVFDPFAGSGTTLAVAKRLGRRWLGYELS